MFAGCVAQACAAGIDLSQYNSLAIAADIDAARAALGHERIVYYGAQLGQHLMQDRPEILEAAVLDGASALSVRSWVQDRVINVEDGIEHLVATCEADACCGASYDIRALLDRAMALFDEGPVPPSYRDPDDPETVIEMILDEADRAMAARQ